MAAFSLGADLVMILLRRLGEHLPQQCLSCVPGPHREVLHTSTCTEQIYSVEETATCTCNPLATTCTTPSIRGQGQQCPKFYPQALAMMLFRPLFPSQAKAMFSDCLSGHTADHLFTSLRFLWFFFPPTITPASFISYISSVLALAYSLSSSFNIQLSHIVPSASRLERCS